MSFIYTFTPPVELTGPRQITKIGITNSWPASRLGKYQLPYGPTWEASYSWLAYHPDPEMIKWLEGNVLGRFRLSNQGLGPGMTEWLVGVSSEEIAQYIQTVCAESAIKLTDFGPGPWTPVRMHTELKQIMTDLDS